MATSDPYDLIKRHNEQIQNSTKEAYNKAWDDYMRKHAAINKNLIGWNLTITFPKLNKRRYFNVSSLRYTRLQQLEIESAYHGEKGAIDIHDILEIETSQAEIWAKEFEVKL